MGNEKHIRVRSISNQKRNKKEELKPLLQTVESTSLDGDQKSRKDCKKLSSVRDYDCFHDDPSNSINRFTVSVENMPQWCVHDSFVTEGYRRLTRSWRGCFLSLAYLHNESGNIYTHGIGALMLIPLSFWLLDEMSKIPTTSSADYFIQFSYLAGLCACLTTSTIFHLCCCHSQGVSIACNKADYIGIVFLQIGSFLPALYYGFFCDSFHQILYGVSVVILGLLTIWITAGPHFAAAQFRWIRTSFFTLFGAVGAIPSIHHVWRYGFEMSKSSFGILDVIGVGACYLVGAFFYVHRVPERWYPGRFDIIGQSHQIWHLFVLAAAFWHFSSVFKMYRWWHLNNATCSLSDHQLISAFS